MSSLTYRGVKLDLLNTQPTERRDVLSDDGTTYLHTQWHIDVIGELNPQLNSFKAGPLAQTGVAPVASDQAIRHFMMQPQGRLTWVVGDTTVLDVPVPPLLTDADNGPTPLSFDIIKFLGEFKTWMVRFRIVAAVNECKLPTSQGRPPVLLSNRWAMAVDVDEDHFTTRIVRGEAVFRNDMLLAANLNADQFRSVLIHPIPPGFHREAVRCELDSDGNTYRYTVVDAEDASSFNLGTVTTGVTRLEAWQTNHVRGPLPVGLLAGQALAAVAATARATEFGNPIGIAGAGLAAVAEASLRLLPTSYSHFLVKIWGNKLSTRLRLQKMAQAVALSRFNVAWVLGNATGIEATITHDLMNRYCELVLTVQKGVLGAGDIFNVFDPNADFGFPSDDKIDDLTVAGTQQTTRFGPPESNKTRGTYLDNLIAQSLQQPCALPAPVFVNGLVPIDPPVNRDVDLQ